MKTVAVAVTVELRELASRGQAQGFVGFIMHGPVATVYNAIHLRTFADAHLYDCGHGQQYVQSQ
jgi:hypothetical protein